MSEQWRPGASHEVLKLRARMLADIRSFFANRDVLEVETPLLSRAATTDPHIESFVTQYAGPGAARPVPLYLHTSPEFPMKRLLASGSGSIYQICKVFRNGEHGRRHNPEFTMLEWYRVGYDCDRLMQEVEELVLSLLPSTKIPHRVERITYADLFREHAGFDPHHTSLEEIRASLQGYVEVPEQMSGEERDTWLDLVLTERVEPALRQYGMLFVRDYPASQAALAATRVNSDGIEVAERFELYLHGVELANGFHELQDARQQAQRFSAEQARRKAQGLVHMPEDQQLIQALDAGLPDCSGVALGLDRLLMVLADATSIDQVLAFGYESA